MPAAQLYPARPAHRGFTLVEMMVAIALAVVLLSLSVPSFTGMLARMRIEGASHNLATDLQLARTEAVQRRAAVTLATLGDGSGYTITSGSTTLKSVTFASGVSFTGGVGISFDPLRALANAATLTGGSAGTASRLRVSTDVMGRVQLCSPDASFKGYAPC
jgi:prepilin-type N-terminal cleavage/methylation domain-containing protein